MSNRRGKYNETSSQRNNFARRLNSLNNILNDTSQDLQEINQNLRKGRWRRNMGSYDDNDIYHSQTNIRSSYSDTDEYRNETNGHRMSREYIYSRHKSRSNQSLDESLSDSDMRARDYSEEHTQSHAKRERGGQQYQKQRQSSTESSAALDERIEHRLQKVYHRLKKKFNNNNPKSQATPKSANDEIKQMLDELRNSKEKENQQKLTDYEMAAQKTQNELIMAKRRLVELQESKLSLSEQVKRLRDQLETVESTSSSSPVNRQVDLVREIESLKRQLQLSQQPQPAPPQMWTNHPAEHNLSFERYKQEIQSLREDNQELKTTLKERDATEREQKLEIKNLQDRLSKLEQENSRLNQMNMDSLTSASRLRLIEDELQQSERKRDELKQDAEESIKLWKNKVKKLEKSLESAQTKCEHLNEQVEFLKASAVNVSAQCESIQQDNFFLKDLNKKLENKCSTLESELNSIKIQFDNYKLEVSSSKVHNMENQKAYESKWGYIETDRADLQTRLSSEEARNNELNKKLNDIQYQLETVKSENKDLLSYVARLEDESQKLKSSLNVVVKSEEDAKAEVENMSKKVLQNKENYEENMEKYANQLQQAHFQIQKVKLEYEEKWRSIQLQLAEERTSNEIVKKREKELQKTIEEIRFEKQRIEEELSNLQIDFEKLERNDNEKNRVINEQDEKNQRLLEELNNLNAHRYNIEIEFMKILNLIGAEIDLLVSSLGINLNKTYQPLIELDQGDKINLYYVAIKHKVNWIGKSLEELFQLKFKFQQEIVFLEHELESVKKSSVHNFKAQHVFLKNLETQNTELLADRAIALKNMELFEKYLYNLTESVKQHTNREIERTHHLLALDNFNCLSNSKGLSDNEKSEILDRFKRYKKTICEIKLQLDSNPLNRKLGNGEAKSEKQSVKSNGRSSAGTGCKKQQIQKPKPFK